MPTTELARLRREMTRLCRADESACVTGLQRGFATGAPDFAAVAATAAELVGRVRAARREAAGVDTLMHEFALSSREGIALMCLAEALLRIPDNATVDHLIRDKIAGGDWLAHSGRDRPFCVNAASWGLMLSGRLVATHSENAPGAALEHLLARGGEPLVRRGVEFAMGLLGRQFVMGETIGAALARGVESGRRGYTHSFDMLGEAAATAADAERYFAAYAGAIDAIGQAAGRRGVVAGPGISVKLSALHPRYCRAQRARVLDELYPRLLTLATMARDHDIGLSIDAEEAERLELSLELIEHLAGEARLAGWNGLGVVVQAYQKRCPAVIDWLLVLARRHDRRLMVRLVKGAYWDAEIKRAQVDGQAGYPVFTRKAHTDLCYLAAAARLLAGADRVYPQFATHNALTLASVTAMAAARGVTDYEFQCLHGMGESLYDQLVGSGAPGSRCRIYAPVGSHRTLLPYLVRRLLENGANSSFVNRLVDADVSLDELLVDPLSLIRRDGGGPHPAIPLPRDLFVASGAARHSASRLNSSGMDLAADAEIEALSAALSRLAGRRWEASPLAAVALPGTTAEAVCNPADHEDVVGSVRAAAPAAIEAALLAAVAAAPAWAALPATERAERLRRCAGALEAARDELLSLCIREAGKTWGNAVAEVREAVDFCRYYAQQLERLTCPVPPASGVLVCISPWNFPLAILVGQVAAALAAGAAVIAKPAEQTPLIAAHAIRLFHAAGIPPAVLQLLPGRGETVGAALTADPRIRGVLFTGSLEVAQRINRALAGRPPGRPEPLLIAETGGQNAMIVDSSALAEQVVRDVLASGFDSAGQRCSALRVLCLQEEIADELLAMLEGALRELQVGDPRQLACDIGPIIDAAARDAIEAHVETMRNAGHRIFRCPLPAQCAAGSFVPPTLIEIDTIEQLRDEVFGPVVHVLRFAADRLDALIDAINACGCGLTFGLHSRIDARIGEVVGRVRAGNLYINRNMVGAVVGVQPFGGEGRSGTGPKAGGPLMLPRLLGLDNLPLAALGLAPAGAEAGQRCPALGALAAWAQRRERPALAARCAEYAAHSPLATRTSLPGPTGESNTLSFVPRGPVLCLASDAETLLGQLAAVLASGNRALLGSAVERIPGVADLLADLPPEVRSVIEPTSGAAPGERAVAVLFAGPEAELAGLRRRLAAAAGALCPLLIPDPVSGAWPLHRLLSERVVSINTAAAGGNAALLALSG